MELKLAKLLKGVERIAIDTAPFIYFIEENKSYIDILDILFTKINEGRFTAYTSVVTLIEVITKPIADDNEELVARYSAILTNSAHLSIVDIDSSMAVEVARLRAKYHIKTPDAIQIATGIVNGAKVFITNDANLKRVKEIKVVLLDELLK